MPLALAIGKGQGASPQQSSALRGICAHPLACRPHVCARWAPGELNPADAPSRGLRCIKPVDSEAADAL
eukprot:6952753-Pyramimonas_sp.AAC.1